MRIEMLLEMAASAHGDRVGYCDAASRLTYAELQAQAARGAAFARARGASAIVTLAEASTATPVTLFAAAMAGIPYIPLNYRLAPESIARLLAKHPGALVIGPAAGHATLDVADWQARIGSGPVPVVQGEGDESAIAALIYTSGTTSEPKAAVLRHANLVRYVLENTEFGSSGPEEAALACLPPYHIAGLMSLLSNLYTGRRVVLLPRFDAAQWSAMVESESVTHATVVPTMLARLLAWVASRPHPPAFSSLASLASGGAMLPVPVARRVMELWPHVGLVNGYGLTETSSTVSVMDPASYRAAMHSTDEAVRARIASVGRPVPGVEVQVRRPDGAVAGIGEQGEIFLRGDQVSGEYIGRQAAADRWFPTRDLGYLDAGGYLFVLGRGDDTIIRGGENIAPAMIEEVLLEAPGVADAAVVGLPDEEWGQKLAAVVVPQGKAIDPEALKDWCRSRLRSSMTPDQIWLWPELPTNDAGKVVRREIVRRLTEPQA